MHTIRERNSGWHARYGYSPHRGFYVDVFSGGDQVGTYDCTSCDYDLARPLEGALRTLVTMELLNGACVEEILRQRGTGREPGGKGHRRVDRALRTLEEEAFGT
jgi:hypothetical protein